MSEQKNEVKSTENQKLEASFSTLILSIGSTAAIALGMAPNPQTGEIEKDGNLARFNIDLLLMLKDKTKSNLSGEEGKFLEQMLYDLQMAFVRESTTTKK